MLSALIFAGRVVAIELPQALVLRVGGWRDCGASGELVANRTLHMSGGRHRDITWWGSEWRVTYTSQRMYGSSDTLGAYNLHLEPTLYTWSLQFTLGGLQFTLGAYSPVPPDA
jgi:hypothetical protein